MIVDLHDADGEPLTVDLAKLKTIEPRGALTRLTFEDGSTTTVRETIEFNGAAL